MISIGFIILIVSICLHLQKGLDFFIQAFFFPHHRWLIGPDATSLYFLFYSTARFIPWVAGGGILIRLLFDYRKHRKWNLALLGPLCFIALLPIITGILKAVTGQPCPNAFASFAGPLKDATYYVAGARCFPGGHSSAGFALMGIALAIHHEGKKRMAWFLALAWGFILAFFQVGRGVHFTSDGFATFGVGLILYGGIEMLLERKR